MGRFVKIILLIIISMCLFNQDSLYGIEKTKKKIKSWNLDLSFSSYYDNNVLRNSEKYIERFENNQDEGRFHINRYDDIVLDYDVRFSYRHQVIKKLNTIFSSSVNYNAFTFNTVKNWTSFNLGLQQFLSKPTSIMISYNYIPDYYVKHYRDADWVNVLGFTPETFQPFSFAKNDLSFWLQYDLQSATRLRAYFSYIKYFHNEHFTEYDSNNLLYGLRIFHTFNNTFSADAGYRYITSDARGYDEPGEVKQFSDDGDASNYEHTLFTGVNIKLPPVFGMRNTLGITALFSSRSYTTDHNSLEDPLHAGRFDSYYSAEINYSISLMSNISMDAFIRMISRDADTDYILNKQFISNEKDYTQNLIGLSFSYKFNF